MVRMALLLKRLEAFKTKVKDPAAARKIEADIVSREKLLAEKEKRRRRLDPTPPPCGLAYFGLPGSGAVPVSATPLSTADGKSAKVPLPGRSIKGHKSTPPPKPKREKMSRDDVFALVDQTIQKLDKPHPRGHGRLDESMEIADIDKLLGNLDTDAEMPPLTPIPDPDEPDAELVRMEDEPTGEPYAEEIQEEARPSPTPAPVAKNAAVHEPDEEALEALFQDLAQKTSTQEVGPVQAPEASDRKPEKKSPVGYAPAIYQDSSELKSPSPEPKAGSDLPEVGAAKKHEKSEEVLSDILKGLDAGEKTDEKKGVDLMEFLGEMPSATDASADTLEKMFSETSGTPAASAHVDADLEALLGGGSPLFPSSPELQAHDAEKPMAVPSSSSASNIDDMMSQLGVASADGLLEPEARPASDLGRLDDLLGLDDKVTAPASAVEAAPGEMATAGEASKPPTLIPLRDPEQVEGFADLLNDLSADFEVKDAKKKK